MRIAYLCADPGIPVFGRKGCSIHVQEVIGALLRQNAEVHLFANRFDGVVPSGLESVTTHRLPALPKVEPSVREQLALESNAVVQEFLVREGPFDLVYERYSLWSYAGMEYAQAAETVGLLEVNAPLIEEQTNHRDLIHRAEADQVARQVYATATYLIAVSREVARYLETFPDARGRIHVISNGVNPHRFPVGLQPSHPSPEDVFTVGFVGTLKPWHGLSVLLDAFADLHQSRPNSRLLIVGDGTERDWLIEELASRRLENAAHLTGAVAPSEVPGLLASMDVGVAPYPLESSFYFSPLKVFEYMAAGLPVVASRVGQLAELIQGGENGLLCPPGDAKALTAALHRLQRDTALRTRLGRSARGTVLTHYTWDGVARKILALGGLGAPPQLTENTFCC